MTSVYFKNKFWEPNLQKMISREWGLNRIKMKIFFVNTYKIIFRCLHIPENLFWRDPKDSSNNLYFFVLSNFPVIGKRILQSS